MKDVTDIFARDEAAPDSLPLVSVCVPCYNRPEMTRQLIRSVQRQRYANIELIISDDSPTENIATVVAAAASDGSPSIVYRRNVPGLGYALNLRQAILAATGQLIIILGDDDIFARIDAVERYVSAFARHPSVSYIYANQAQISADLKVERIGRFFEGERTFKAGIDAFEHIWSTSIFIPGMAFRNSPELASWYPSEVMLFPQMTLVGNIIAQNDALGLPDVLIGGRAHADQLGFHAIKGQRITGTERHGTLESLDIFDELAAKYRLDLTSDFLERQICEALSFSVLKEALVVGRTLAKANLAGFMQASPVAQRSWRLRFSMLLLWTAPLPLLGLLRRLFLRVDEFRSPKEYSDIQTSIRAISA